MTGRQKEAILYNEGPLLIIAGPGSGKTEILAWKIAHLIKDIGIPYDRILVTTFTDKAALELKD